ncbi:MAG: hypothetical protein F7C33_05300 [Desulfurococcales archaeon]|nr:hypothetical protein [Desulfurococcales archaeon]
MVEPALMRRLVSGLGTALITAISLLTSNTLPLTRIFRVVTGTFGTTMLYISVALALAIHRSFPGSHDRPEEVGELLTEGPYGLCRHPFYFLVMLAQASIP